jgi:signal peptidase I
MTLSCPAVRFLREWLRFAALTVVLFVLVRSFVVEAFTIPTSSMEGTLLVGDFLLVNKALYGAEIPGLNRSLPPIREPARGDVVVFNPPHDPHRDYVKRIVGLPGDTLEMRDKLLFLNGVAQDEAYARHIDHRGDAVHPSMGWQSGYLAAARHPRRYSPSRDNWGPLLVPDGKYFVLGDNRDNSEDSRYWGFIRRENIRGHPWVVYLSLRPERGSSTPWIRRVRWDRTGERIR